MSALVDVRDLLRGRRRFRTAKPNLKQIALDLGADEQPVQVYTEDEDSRLFETVEKALAGQYQSEQARPHVDSPSLRQLDLDFEANADAVQVRKQVEESRLIHKVAKALAEAPENFDDLDDPAVFAHRICLIWHVNTFAYARNQAQRDEAIEWFLRPPRFDWYEKDLSKADPLLIPFTFELCCLLEGIDVRLARASILKLNEKLQGKPLRRRPYVNSDPACKAATGSTEANGAAVHRKNCA